MRTTALIRRGARRHANRVAVVHRGRAMTFAEVDRLSNRFANVLIAQGIQPQDRVALLVDNSLMSIPLDFACLKARAVRVPLNPRLSPVEHARMVTDTGAKLLVASTMLADRAIAIGKAVDAPLAGLTTDALEMLARRASDKDPMLPTPADDVVLALYTSGTTGTLKAAQHTQASYAAVVTNILANLVCPDRDDAMVHAASLIHASGTFVLPFWLAGARSVVLDGFDPATYLSDVASNGGTHANLVPTMLQMLLEGDAPLPERVRSVIYGASPMPRPVIERALERYGPVFTQYYGQTEAPLALAVLAAEDHVGDDAPLGACGIPSVDVSMRLVDEDGADVGEGEIGEIAVAGPMVHAGYLGAPGLDVRLADGSIRTRDLGRFDARGFLHLADRTSDMIVTGGYNVYPREVEEALLAHPAVVECAVVGAPDRKWVEAVTAFVVVKRPVDPALLQSFARERLAGYKVPKDVRFVDALPKSAVGKILRRKLRDALREEPA